MRGKLAILLLLACLSLKAQSINNGQRVLISTPTPAFDTTFLSSSMTMTTNVSSYTIANGLFAAQVHHLSICQGTGGPYSVSGQPNNVIGVTGPLSPVGCTYFRLVWDSVAGKWISSIIGMNPQGFIPEYNSSGIQIVGYSCTLLQGTSTTSGTFSITYTANPLWTTPSSVFVRALSVQSTGTTPANSYTAYWTLVSTTSVSGVVKSGTTLSILGATLIAGTVAEPITVEVCGW